LPISGDIYFRGRRKRFRRCERGKYHQDRYRYLTGNIRAEIISPVRFPFSWSRSRERRFLPAFIDRTIWLSYLSYLRSTLALTHAGEISIKRSRGVKRAGEQGENTFGVAGDRLARVVVTVDFCIPGTDIHFLPSSISFVPPLSLLRTPVSAREQLLFPPPVFAAFLPSSVFFAVAFAGSIEFSTKSTRREYNSLKRAKVHTWRRNQSEKPRSIACPQMIVRVIINYRDNASR